MIKRFKVRAHLLVVEIITVTDRQFAMVYTDSENIAVVETGMESVPDASPALLVDQRGARCPIPVLALKRALRGCEAGQVVELLATDPDSARDIPRFVSDAKLDLVSSSQSEGVFRFCVRK